MVLWEFSLIGIVFRGAVSGGTLVIQPIQLVHLTAIYFLQKCGLTDGRSLACEDLGSGEEYLNGRSELLTPTLCMTSKAFKTYRVNIHELTRECITKRYLKRGIFERSPRQSGTMMSRG
jgi:hypothetical protein